MIMVSFGRPPRRAHLARDGRPFPLQSFADAHNALWAMALHYLRSPAANVPGARRKAAQALAALRRLESAELERCGMKRNQELSRKCSWPQCLKQWPAACIRCGRC